jgi:hypothetical protein
MKWMRERDLLIAQTMAFVQSVAGRKPEAEVFARPDITPVTSTRLPDVEAMLAEALGVPEPPAAAEPVALESVKPVPPVRPTGRSDYRNEIQARVEKFRAHQARFNREREAYCSATMAKMHATLDKCSVPRTSK